MSFFELILSLVAINLVTFTSFGLDKLLAEAQRRRMREATLLWFAALGGTPGAYAGRALFRHKTRKQPFSNRLHAIAALQLLLLAGAVGLAGGGWFGGA